MPRPFKEKDTEKMEKQATFPNSFYDARITLILKSDTDTTRKKNKTKKLQTSIPYENGCKHTEKTSNRHFCKEDT